MERLEKLLNKAMEKRNELVEKLQDLQLIKFDEVESLFDELKELAKSYNKENK